MVPVLTPVRAMRAPCSKNLTLTCIFSGGSDGRRSRDLTIFSPVLGSRRIVEHSATSVQLIGRHSSDECHREILLALNRLTSSIRSV